METEQAWLLGDGPSESTETPPKAPMSWPVGVGSLVSAPHQSPGSNCCYKGVTLECAPGPDRCSALLEWVRAGGRGGNVVATAAPAWELAFSREPPSPEAQHSTLSPRQTRPAGGRRPGSWHRGRQCPGFPAVMDAGGWRFSFLGGFRGSIQKHLCVEGTRAVTKTGLNDRK